MKPFIPLLEIIICMNLLLAVSSIFFKKIFYSQKPLFQLYLARLLFLSCILSPIVLSLISVPQFTFNTSKVVNHVIDNSPYQSIKSKINESIDEATISVIPKSKIDLSYLYLFAAVLLISGSLYRSYKTINDIYKIKSIIDSAQQYKQIGCTSIKISYQCAVPFSVRFVKNAYIILPISILHSLTNTKLAIRHEGQHHRQKDCIWAYLIEFIRILFWFNPALNYWYNMFKELQELACDEALISNKKVSAYDYGACLFNVAKTASQYLHAHQQDFACTAQMISGRENEASLLTRRICMLTQYQDDRMTKKMLGSVLAISVITIVSTLGTAYAAKGLISRDVALNSIDISSLDPIIQKIAANEITGAVAKSNAKSGVIVIADARTGKIVAFAESGKSTENNSWKSRTFNPASTIKPFIAAAAIDAGVATESKIYDCHEPFQVDGKTYTNNDTNIRNLSVSDAIAKSVNICMIKVAQDTGASKSRHTLSSFGFDTDSAWDKHSSDALNLANTAMGTSIPVTLGTLTNAYTILANNGHLPSSNSEAAITELTAKSVTRLLEKAVTSGTGKHAVIANVSVAGKTGTLSDSTHATTLALFAGYVPSISPRYVSVVVIENASVNGSLTKANGGNVAAPVFRQALEKSLAISK